MAMAHIALLSALHYAAPKPSAWTHPNLAETLSRVFIALEEQGTRGAALRASGPAGILRAVNATQRRRACQSPTTCPARPRS